MPKISGRTLSEHRNKTRRRLMDALDSLITERGFEAVSMSDVAARSGIRRTTIYNHFTDKEDLLIAFVEEKTSEYLSTTKKMLEGVDSSIDRLQIYVHSQLLAERSYLIAPGPPLKDVVTPSTGMKLARHGRQTAMLLSSILENAIDDGTIPDQDIRTAIQVINGTLSGRRIPKEDPERTEFFRYTERFIIQGLGAVLPDTSEGLTSAPAV